MTDESNVSRIVKEDTLRILGEAKGKLSLKEQKRRLISRNYSSPPENGRAISKGQSSSTWTNSGKGAGFAYHPRKCTLAKGAGKEAIT